MSAEERDRFLANADADAERLTCSSRACSIWRGRT